MNLEKEFTRINGALTTCENGQQLSQDLVKIQQELITFKNTCCMYWDEVKDTEEKLKKMTTLADDLSHIYCEMHKDLANWDPKAGEEYEMKFNEAMKIK